MLHETVTISPISTALFSRHPDDVISPVRSPLNNFSIRDMLSTRRPTPGRVPSKTDLSERSMMSPGAGNARWRLNGNGQLVDADWDLADGMTKLNMGEGPGGQMRTAPQPKSGSGTVIQVHETSPLESSSETSLDTNSSVLDPSTALGSHSRGSSADTTGSAFSSNSQTLKPAPYTNAKLSSLGESRNRPHSYSGGLSSTDLYRLQQAGSPANKGDSWSSPNGTPERQQQDQLTYPSLTVHTGVSRQEQGLSSAVTARGDDFEEYQAQQRQFGPSSQGVSAGAQPSYSGPRANNAGANTQYRQQAPRQFNPGAQVPPVMQPPNNFGYPAPLHPAALPMGTPPQQLYDMMLPTPPLENPAMARLQQQHGIFRGGHQHSSSDPASLRDPATLAMLNQAFANQLYGAALQPPGALSMLPLYAIPNATPEQIATAQMMAQLQVQYAGSYGVPIPGQGVAPPASAQPTSSTAGGSQNGSGPSANNRKLGLYKTELCRSWEEKGTCRYGTKCQFAHGEDELRKVSRHPKYKTEICRTFWVSGSCPYGKRCCFIHTELPVNGAPPGAEGAPPPQISEGRVRSGSTTSDPNEMPSLLQRIRKEPGASGPSNGSTTPPTPSIATNGRPDKMRLVLDTSMLDPATSMKQNKSAYPTFANTHLLPAPEEITARSPGPVTAGPDFGRHANARMEIVGTQSKRVGKGSTLAPNARHSFNGSDIQLDFNSMTPTATNANPELGSSPPDAASLANRMNGHARSGSAGNWGGSTRQGHLSAYGGPLSSIPGGELKTNSPWADYNAASRLSEQNWA